MDLGGLILLLLIIGVVLYFFPIDGMIKNIILCLIVLAVLVTLFHGYGGGHWKF